MDDSLLSVNRVKQLLAMMLLLSHKKMIVWHKCLELLREIYRITAQFPDEEKYGLTGQLRRAAVSVISNIAEGEARRAGKEKRRFYEMACSSLVEIDAQIEIALLLEYVHSQHIKQLSLMINECFAILSTLKRTR